MSYLKWFDEHAQKHAAIVQKLLTQNYNKEQIIDYFVYENMSCCEPDFCPLYQRGVKCHERAYLNCYWCACPHFRFHDEGIRKCDDTIVKSECSIDSKKALYFVHENVSHLDCSRCVVPHTRAFISKHFNLDWKKAMQSCQLHL